MRWWLITVAIVTVALCLPSAVWAQATLAGDVRDTSGAVLPGVTVEASSPVLIEKVRTGVTDGGGKYRIEDLRPGTYSVTFTLPGFATVKRAGLIVTGSGVITIDAELRIGGVEETIVVTGAAPVVDVQSVQRQVTLDNETVRNIPSVRSYTALLATVPGIQTSRNNLTAGPQITFFPINGGRLSESRVFVDGLNVGIPSGGHYAVDIDNAAEVSTLTSGALGEAETGGIIMNVIPKTGGNSNTGMAFFSGFSEGMQSDNYDDGLQSRGVLQPTLFQKVYDVKGSFGGPIRQDRLWYYASATRKGQRKDTLNLFFNKNAGNPNEWRYVPDLDQPAYSDRVWEAYNARVTLQASKRNKFSVFWDEQAVCRSCTGATANSGLPSGTTAPEADGIGDFTPQRVQQVTWSSPVTNRLLLDAGFGDTYFRWGNSERNPNPTRDLVRVVEQGAVQIAPGVAIGGVTYRSQNWMDAYQGWFTWRASATFVTGAHSFKVGHQGGLWKDDKSLYTNSQALQYTFLNGVPNTITEYITPWFISARARQISFYAQEQWTLGRVTLQGALRYDRASSSFPEQVNGQTRFLRETIAFPELKGVDAYHDITPRMGAAWNVSGDRKTAVKAYLGRYLDGASSSGIYGGVNPVLRLPGAAGTGGITNPAVTRSWIDGNGNFNPDCDLTNRGAQDFRATGGDLCGALTNQSFGSTTLTDNYDPNILRGWGVRPSDWAGGVAVQRELFTRASVEVAYNHRWFRGQMITDNLSVSPSDYDAFSIKAPLDPRLPDGGGYTISNLLAIKPDAALRAPNNFVTVYENDYRWFDGIDLTFNLRGAHGLTLNGGTSTGQTSNDTCAIRERVPGSAPFNPYCRTTTPWLTQLRGLVTYTIPRIDVVISSVFQDKPGAPGIDASLAANYSVPVADIIPSLGRPLALNAQVASVNLVQPLTLYGDRVRQLDLGLKKRFAFRNKRVMLGVDFYNVTNTNVTLTYNSTYLRPPSTAWLNPTEYLNPRITRLTAEFTF